MVHGNFVDGSVLANVEDVSVEIAYFLAGHRCRVFVSVSLEVGGDRV